MVNLELYVVEDVDDAIAVGSEGIYDFTIDGSECENCSMVIGPIKDTFIACVLIATPDRSWPICIECAYPLLFPADAIAIISIEQAFEELGIDMDDIDFDDDEDF